MCCCVAKLQTPRCTCAAVRSRTTVLLIQEEGPVKEHLLQEVYERRQKHKDGQLAGTGKDECRLQFDSADGEVMEQDAEYQSLDGEEVSAFNMNEEEEAGFNVETGEIVRRKTEEDELAKDPWLQSLQQEEVPYPTSSPALRSAPVSRSTVPWPSLLHAQTSSKQAARGLTQRERHHSDAGDVTDKVRRYQVTVAPAVRERLQAQQEALENAQPLPDSEIAAARALLIQHLQPRESIMQGLARFSSALKAPAAVRAPPSTRTRAPACMRAPPSTHTTGTAMSSTCARNPQALAPGPPACAEDISTRSIPPRQWEV